MNTEIPFCRTPVVAIVQARMSSRRLEGKVLKDICGSPMLAHVVGRLSYSGLIERIVVATSTDPSDEPIARWCEREGVALYRGELDDVLDRYYNAALAFGARTIVRITADCPLIDPQVVDGVIAHLIDGMYDCAGTDHTYPDGLDTEVFTMLALRKAWQHARWGSEREHVTPYMWKHPERFRLLRLPAPERLGHLRWTVDEPADLELVRRIYGWFQGKKDMFFMEDVLKLLRQRPELMEINRGIQRNEGYQRSLREDRLVRSV